MSLFIESISIEDGVIQNLDLHNKRCNKARKEILLLDKPINLANYIFPPKHFLSDQIKCRIIFSKDVQEVSYQKYAIRNIQKVRLLENNNIEYAHKLLDRTELKKMFEKRNGADEILIVKKGFITDAHYYNVAFLKDKIWFTPRTPLLHGVQRTRLLQQSKIQEEDITTDSLKNYSMLCLFNALTPLGAIQIPVEHLV